MAEIGKDCEEGTAGFTRTAGGDTPSALTACSCGARNMVDSVARSLCNVSLHLLLFRFISVSISELINVKYNAAFQSASFSDHRRFCGALVLRLTGGVDAFHEFRVDVGWHLGSKRTRLVWQSCDTRTLYLVHRVLHIHSYIHTYKFI